MDEERKRSVEAATVKLVWRTDAARRAIGRGVLVRGGFILTAAHNVNWDGTGSLAQGKPSMELVEMARGERFLMQVTAVDALSDIAVLEAADYEEFPDDWERFEEWAAVDALGIRATPREHDGPAGDLGTPLVDVPNSRELVHVLTHTGEWVEGVVVTSPGVQRRRGRTEVVVSKHIESGTSGCAVVDQRGDLLGVISTASVPPAFPTAVMALARSLPWWVWRALVKVDGLVSEPADVVPSGPAR